MGCAPSKGNNFGTRGPIRKGTALLPGTQECPSEPPCDDVGPTVPADGDPREKKSAVHNHSSQKEAPSTPQKKKSSVSELVPEAVAIEKLGSQQVDNNTLAQKDKQGDKQDTTDKKTGRKPKKNSRGNKSIKKKEKDKKVPLLEQKVDFPEPLVKAHQAAYAFLNPSITKYDILLGLLEQATQTQVSAQPMVAFMALRYAEINHELEEMADEGEKLLKENGEHLAWPSQMKNLSSNPPLKSDSASSEPPPDLLQQLLQYTTQRMRNVCQTVAGISATALEEAIEYFASVSELLEQKLKAKRAAEARLMQLLTRIEMASLRKPGPEDSTLFSEDSGIGAESESLAGSERRLRRESCESSGTSRTTPCSPMGRSAKPAKQVLSRRKPTHKISPSVSLNSIDSACTIMAKEHKDTESLLGSVSLDDGDEEEDEEDDDDEMDRDMGKNEAGAKKRSNSSPTDPHQQPQRLPSRRIENPQNVEMTLKMKDAISGRIQFVPSQHASAKTKPTDSPKISRRQWGEDEEKSHRRPQTAAPVRKAAVKKTLVAKDRRTHSAESLRSRAEDPTLLELERTQRDLSQRLEKMNKKKTGGAIKVCSSKSSQGNSPAKSPTINRTCPSQDKNNSPQPNKDRAGLVRHNNGEQVDNREMDDDKRKKGSKISKGPMKATPPPSPPMTPRPSSGLHRGRNSVKKLIDTFSQGLEDQEGSRVLGPLKGVRKCGVPVLPGLGNVEAVLSSGITSCRTESTPSEKNYDLDLDSLPPPPLEVLMDNSFEDAQSILSSEAEDGAGSRGRSPVTKRAVISQRLRSSVQSVTVLPSKGSFPQGSRNMSPARTEKRDISAHSRISQPDAKPEVDTEKEQTASLYKQSRKIIHLQHSSEPPLDKSSASYLASKPSRAGSAEDQDGCSPPVPGTNISASTVPPTSVVNSQSPIGQHLVSRARMLPSTPSTPSSFHRRLPSPQTLRGQPTPPASTSPPVNHKLPTPPIQRRLPSTPATRQVISSSNSASSYPFKAPSPPASPKVKRWSRESSGDESSTLTRLFSNARSVFCPASPSLFESKPCPVPQPPQAWISGGVSVLPRPWGDRGRFNVRGPQPFIRRSHSDRRPSLTLPSRPPPRSVAEICGSEPAISTQGLEDGPIRDDQLWGSQSDLRATSRSASQPDLCIVGQALHLE